MKIAWLLPVAFLLVGCARQDESHQQTQSAARTAEAPKTTVDSRPVIAAFGDSLTAGMGLDPGQGYPEQLQKELDRRGQAYRVVNLGESGDTTQDGVERLSMVLAQKPAIVVLELGANDGLRGLPVANTEKNLAQMIEALQQSDARVVLAGITLPPNYGPEYIRKFDAIYKNLAKKYRVKLIPFFLEGVAGNANLMQRDGLHPTAEGAKIVANTVWKALEL